MERKTEAALQATLTEFALRKMGWSVERVDNELLVEDRSFPVMDAVQLQSDLLDCRLLGVLSDFTVDVGAFQFGAVVKVAPLPENNAWSTVTE